MLENLGNTAIAKLCIHLGCVIVKSSWLPPSQSLTRPLRPDDTVALAAHTSRVRVLHLGNDFSCCHLLPQFCALQSPLFPRLKELDWRSILETQHRIFLVLPSTLENPVLNLDDVDSELQATHAAVIGMIPPTLPNLRTLVVMTRANESPRGRQTVTEIIPQLLHLRKLLLPRLTLSESSVYCLATFSFLHTLGFEVDRHSPPPNLSPGSFPALHSLDVSGYLHGVIRCIHYAPPGQLQTLAITVSDYASSFANLMAGLDTMHLMRLNALRQYICIGRASRPALVHPLFRPSSPFASSTQSSCAFVVILSRFRTMMSK